MQSTGQFTCDCGGTVEPLDSDHVLHACRLKGAPATSYYDGIDRPIQYRRSRVNPVLTGGEEQYNWFVDWRSSASDRV